ncbi:hypothetical protein [Hymenobacter arizonensis]|uniref:Uncharacterized protein n=1 Tax=Hymenobacter arizonensis TaxID=1227077 RepID=A0A1I5UP25_HYMAR|nr:hypothetical protein [Hymenobacter arizonensis]SFP96980.1 hypothetical protein SAMN04515668_1010 [Hymenobacter arizonensis]
MRFYLLCLIGFNFTVLPLAAQTVVLPTSAGGKASTISDKPDNALVLADKVRNVTEIGLSGYDAVAFDMRPRLTRGTPFLVPGWAMGEVLLGNQDQPIEGVLKFDIHNQQLRAMRPQGDSLILASHAIKTFMLRPTGPDGKPVERRFDQVPSGLVPSLGVAFAENLSTGNEVSLLKLQWKTILKGQVESTYNSNKPTDSYQINSQYYLRWADGSMTPVKPTSNSILAALAMRQAAAAAVEAQNKSKARTDAELAAIVRRVNDKSTTKQ